MKRHRSVLLKITALGRCAARSDHFLVQSSFSLAVRYLLLKDIGPKVGTVRHSSVPVPTSVTNKGKTREKEKRKEKRKEKERKGKEKGKSRGSENTINVF